MALWPLNRSIKKTVQEDEKLGSREVPSDGTKTVVFRFDFSKKFFEELFTFGFLRKRFFFSKQDLHPHQSFLSKHYAL